MSQIKQLINELKKIGGVSFTAFNYKDKEGEISKRLVNIGVSYKKALEKDFEYLSNLHFNDVLKEQARIELLKSVILSLLKNMKEERIQHFELKKHIKQEVKSNLLIFTEKEKQIHKKRSDAQSEAYINICTGLKYHTEKGLLYIFGTSVKKTVIEAVEKKDTRKPLTKAKDELRSEMKSTKYRLFLIENLESNYKINGQTLEL